MQTVCFKFKSQMAQTNDAEHINISRMENHNRDSYTVKNKSYIIKAIREMDQQPRRMHQDKICNQQVSQLAIYTPGARKMVET
jgi:hypothetical protein